MGVGMQLALMHESITDAIREVIQAAGGPKKVGAMLWPDQPADHAAGRVRDCLNADRRERFTPDQVMFILRIGRECGCHSLINYISRESGYADPQPIEPEDELARLQREFVESTKAIGHMAARIEAITTHSMRRVA